jgi:glutathione-regulated potassium-efflux system ancillary protein KefC
MYRMDPAFLLAPLVGGLIALALRLPPLVGFLASGFVLGALGFSASDAPALEPVADIGVTLLLFTIGLKLNVRTLLRGEVWGTATLHIIASTAIFVGLLGVVKFLGFALLADTEGSSLLVLAFALSFSSTVFAVKVLEQRSESRSLYGRIAIGVLIMQDIFAVVFIGASTGEPPSPWALLLVLLIPAARPLRGLLPRLGHGEMQILYGVALALVLGYALFELVGIKGDLGALIIGMLLAPHPAAEGMAKALFNLKELFLVGFFLTVGLAGVPTLEMLAMAALLLLALPLKSVLFLGLFSRFRLRHRTTVLSTLALSNYSEFGLIVAVLAAGQGWLGEEWLVVLSLTVAASFALSAVLNSQSESLYARLSPRLRDTAPEKLIPEDRPIELGEAQAVVLGVGRVGRRAYLRLRDHYGLKVLGVENDADKAAALRAEGFNVVVGDAVDSDFWDKLVLREGQIDVILLAMPHHFGNLYALQQLNTRVFTCTIAAAVTYSEEIEPLRQHGAHAVYHLYDQAGSALADRAAEEARLRPPNGDA